MTRPAHSRKDFKAAARVGVVMLLLGTLLTGFGEPDDLLLGSQVSGTPTVGILGGAGGDGQISGEIVSLNTTQGTPRLVLSTTAGYVTIVLADPLMVAGLGVGVTATFAGQYDSADVFNAGQVLSNTLAGGDLTLGDPLSGPGTYGAAGNGGGIILGGAPGATGGTGSTSRGTGGTTSAPGTSTGGSSGLTTPNCPSSNKSCPKLELAVSEEEVDSGQDFRVTLEARDTDGIESMWWWISSTDDEGEQDTKIRECKNASRCQRSWTINVEDTGTIVIHAQARDAFGNLSREHEVEVKLRKGKTPTPTKTATRTPTATSTAKT